MNVKNERTPLLSKVLFVRDGGCGEFTLLVVVYIVRLVGRLKKWLDGPLAHLCDQTMSLTSTSQPRISIEIDKGNSRTTSLDSSMII